jgi:hypothetical protein
MLVLLIPGGARCGELQIHVIDVGQGSSELVIGPDGTSILIDGGTGSQGTSNVLPYLNDLFPPGGAISTTLSARTTTTTTSAVSSVSSTAATPRARSCTAGRTRDSGGERRSR